MIGFSDELKGLVAKLGDSFGGRDVLGNSTPRWADVLSGLAKRINVVWHSAFLLRNHENCARVRLQQVSQNELAQTLFCLLCVGA